MDFKVPLAGQMTRQSKRDAEELLMRVHLGLSPIHSLLEAVRVLHDEGRDAFEKMRGPRFSDPAEPTAPLVGARLVVAEQGKLARELEARIAELEAALRQTVSALTEIRDKAPTMENGGAWAAGLAALSVGTLKVTL